MGRFTKYLLNLVPRTGRVILEDGTFKNEADFLALKEIEQLSSQSLLGNAFAASWKGTIASGGGSKDLVLEVPPGINFFLHIRQQTTLGGQITLELRVNPDTGYTAQQTIKGWNLDETLGGVQSQSSIIATTAATTGSVFRREELLAPGGTGSNKSTTATTTADAVANYDQDNSLVLRITNDDNASAVVVISFAWVELPKP